MIVGSFVVVSLAWQMVAKELFEKWFRFRVA